MLDESSCFANDRSVNTAPVQWPFDYTFAVVVAVLLIVVLAYDEWVGHDSSDDRCAWIA